MGISGSGKSQISQAVVERLRHNGLFVLWLDGDQLRECLHLTGHTLNDRIEVGKKYVNLAESFTRQGIHVVLSSIGMNSDLDTYAKCKIPNYTKILIDANLEFVINLGQRPIYTNSTTNVLGKDLSPDLLDYDLRIENSQKSTLNSLIEIATSFCLSTFGSEQRNLKD
jgi:adenylylsulfate kinase-like enzyme